MPTQLIAQARTALQTGMAALRADYEISAKAQNYLHGRAALVDKVLTQLWQAQAFPDSWALVATGGYGRGELFPHSDVDLLILLPNHPAQERQACLAAFITLLWDTGLAIAQSVRTVDECLSACANDITIQTNVLESRLLTGNPTLFAQLSTALQQQMEISAFYKAKSLEQQQRHLRRQDTPFALEPNCKENPGGLRDLQTLMWIARAANFGQSWQELTERKFITPEEAHSLSKAERFLQHTRIRLHLITARAEDRLLFDYQESLATAFGLEASANKRASERFMQKYYLNAKLVVQINTILLQNFGAAIFPGAHSQPVKINAHFQIQRNLLDIKNDLIFQTYPSALLECFLLLQQHPELQGMTARTLRALWQNRQLINARFRAKPENRALFLSIFQQPTGLIHALRRMNQYGILSVYLPAWRRIEGQMQYDLFHVYTVDQHILMVIRNLRRLMVSEHAHEHPLQTTRMLAFERPWVLYIAAFFHDIAKGRGGDHSKLGMADAQLFCKQHGLEQEDIALIVWLVEHHLLMSSVAQKEDTSDPAIIARFAQTVQTERRLTALYLLTHADIRGTSPNVWNGWKSKLLKDLYFITLRTLQGITPLQALGIDKRHEEARSLLRQQGLEAGIENALWQNLDAAYFMRHSAEELAWHTRVLYQDPQSTQAIVKARVLEAQHDIQVMVYVPDQKDLFVRLTGFIGHLNFTILDAKIHTTKHGYALDSFILQAPGHEHEYRHLTTLIEHKLSENLNKPGLPPPPLSGRLSRQVRLFPIEPTVSIQADESGRYAILSISATDRPGLLHTIALLLSAHGLCVSSAKVTTLGERIEDSFLIAGEALSDEAQLLSFEARLEKALRAPGCS